MATHPPLATVVGSSHRCRHSLRPGLALATLALALGVTLSACRPLQPLPGAPEVAAWQKRFKALDCWNPRNDYASSRGDLLVGWQKPRSDEPQITLFQGSRVDHIVAQASFALCPDLGCESMYDQLFAGSWSISGEHFVIGRGFDGVEVYRAADLKMAKRWELKALGKTPAYGYINDQVAYEFNDHSRLTFHSW